MLVVEPEQKGRMASCGIVEMDKIMHKAQDTTPEKTVLIDNGGRRFGRDRRIFIYYGYLPERRSGDERRSGLDRRKKVRHTS
jgi:hypothetical protein